LALTDPLTGLGNHRHFHERLQRELQAAEEHATPLTLCFVDIDDFKRINDRFGHPSGERVLSQVPGKLRQGGPAFPLSADPLGPPSPSCSLNTTKVRPWRLRIRSSNESARWISITAAM